MLFRYTALFIAIQFGACSLLGFISYLLSPRADFLFELVVYIYSPTIYLISKLGNFSGESNMFTPIIAGIPFGILIYGLILGSIFSYFKRT